MVERGKLVERCDCDHGAVWHRNGLGVCGWPGCSCPKYFGRVVRKVGLATPKVVGVVTSGDGKVREEIL